VDTPEPRRLLNNLQWVHVALAFVLCGTVFALVRWGRQDLTTVSTFIIAVAGVVGAFYLKGVRQDSQDVKVLANGNLERKDREISDLQQKLADAQRLHTQEIAQMAAQVTAPALLPQSLVAESHALGAEATSSSTVPLPVFRT
jgi:uncharacterized protein YdbL (DUF1318 family)